ncbi:MAG: hypothetical protein ACE5EI_10870 [Thermodesulfobacteriota bacterium]
MRGASQGGVRRLPVLLLVLLSASVVISGCAGRLGGCASPGSDPVSLYVEGMDLVWEGEVEAAGARLSRAASCDRRSASIQGGLAVQAAIKVTEGAGGQSERLTALDRLVRAARYVSTGEDEFAYRVASMRVYTELKPLRWLARVKDDYKKAMRTRLDEDNLPFYRTREAASYFMGMAYLDAGEYEAAGEMFSGVLSSRRSGRWKGPAERGLDRVEGLTR